MAESSERIRKVSQAAPGRAAIGNKERVCFKNDARKSQVCPKGAGCSFTHLDTTDPVQATKFDNEKHTLDQVRGGKGRGKHRG